MSSQNRAEEEDNQIRSDTENQVGTNGPLQASNLNNLPGNLQGRNDQVENQNVELRASEAIPNDESPRFAQVGVDSHATGLFKERTKEEDPLENSLRLKEEVQKAKLAIHSKLGEGVEHHGSVRHYDPNALCCLKVQNPVRNRLIWLITWVQFDRFIMLIIVINSVLLGMRDYSDRIDPNFDSTYNDTLDQIGIVLSIIFFIECVFKILALGFVVHSKSYLRDSWNRLDFFVVAVSIFDFTSANSGFLKILRMFRMLRPLRSINKLPELRKLIQILMNSVPGMCNVVIFLSFILSLFSIWGVLQFQGQQYQQCRIQAEPDILSTYDAATFIEGTTDPALKWGDWPIAEDAPWLCKTDLDCETMLADQMLLDPTLRPTCGNLDTFGLNVYNDEPWNQELIFFNIVNFDNFLKAFLMLFQAITLEGWSMMMYNVMDTENPIVTFIFFSMLVIFGSFFAIQLVLGEVMRNWDAEREKMAEKLEEEKKLKEKDGVPSKHAEDSNDSGSDNDDDSFQSFDKNISLEHSPKLKKSDPLQEVDQYNKFQTEQKNKVPSSMCGSLPQITESENKSSKEVMQKIKLHENALQENSAMVIKDESSISKVLSPHGQSPMNTNRQDIGEGLQTMQPPIQEAEHSSMIRENNIPSDAFEQYPGEDLSPGSPTEKIALFKNESEADVKARKRSQTNKCYRCFYLLVTAHQFNFFIFLLIIFNTAVLAIDDYPQSKEKGELLHLINVCLCWIFFLEMMLKLIGLGCSNYFKDSFNAFDSIVVFFSVVDFVITLSVAEEDLGSAVAILQSIRALRMLRVVKLARQWNYLQEIIGKVVAMTTEIMLFSVLLLLFIYICALVGLEFFSQRCKFDIEEALVMDPLEHVKTFNTDLQSPRDNFDTIYNAMTTVFIVILGEDWPGVMYNYTRASGSYLTCIYFIVVYCAGNFILLSLFTAILLEKFAPPNEEDDEDNLDTEECDQLSQDSHKSINMNTSQQSNSIEKPTFKDKFQKFKEDFYFQYINAFGTAMDKHRYENVLHKRKLDKIMPVNSPRENTPVKSVASSVSRAKTSIKIEAANKIHPQTILEEKNAPNDLKSDSFEEDQLTVRENNDDAIQIVRQEQRNVTPLRKAQTALSIKEILRDPTHSVSSPSYRKQNSFKPQSGFKLQHLNTKKPKSKDQIQKLQEEHPELRGTSLGILKGNNCFRQTCFKFQKNAVFDWVIMTFIGISTILLALENPHDNPESEKILILGYIDLVMTAIFSLEMVIKIIALGFTMNGEHSYLKNGWNRLDFLIVMASIFSIIFAEYNIGYLKSLRMLRILRPLRLINKNKGLKLSIISLMNSIPNIIKLLLIVMFFTFLLSILCGTLFKGQFFHCNMDMLDDSNLLLPLVEDKWQCLNMGGEWINQDMNFDNIYTSIITLQAFASTEGWISVMWQSVDANGIDKQPVRDNAPYWIILYIFMVIALCLLVINLFVGEIISSFTEEKDKLLQNNKLPKKARKFVNIQLAAYSQKPLIKLETRKDINPVRNTFINVTNNPFFDNFIMACILLNTIILASQYYLMPQSVLDIFENINFVFMIIFTIEAIIKLIAMKTIYFKDSWNVFDFTVVIVTLIILLISAIPDIGINMADQASLLRLLRILRVLRIVKKAKHLQMIFNTIVEAMPSMASLGVLFLLFTFTFSIIGMSLFGMVKNENTMFGLNKHANFQYFTNAFLLLFRCSTGEAWPVLMYDVSRPNSILYQCDETFGYEEYVANDGVVNRCGYPFFGRFYFNFFMLIIGQVFLNLFIAIVVDKFLENADENNSPVEKHDFVEFLEVWKNFDPEGTGFILIDDFDDFLHSLSQTQSGFFKINKDSIADLQCRENLYLRLELPTHQKYTKYMFYDVLINLCRASCQTAYLMDHLKTRFHQIKTIEMLKGKNLSKQVLKMKATGMIMDDDQLDFNKLIASLKVEGGKYSKVELVENINEESARICQKYMKDVDFIDDEDGNTDEHQFYSSRHHIYAKRIGRAWKARRKLKTKDSISRRSGIRHTVNYEPAVEYSTEKASAGSPLKDTVSQFKNTNISINPNEQESRNKVQIKTSLSTNQMFSSSQTRHEITIEQNPTPKLENGTQEDAQNSHSRNENNNEHAKKGGQIQKGAQNETAKNPNTSEENAHSDSRAPKAVGTSSQGEEQKV